MHLFNLQASRISCVYWKQFAEKLVNFHHCDLNVVVLLISSDYCCRNTIHVAIYTKTLGLHVLNHTAVLTAPLSNLSVQ